MSHENVFTAINSDRSNSRACTINILQLVTTILGVLCVVSSVAWNLKDCWSEPGSVLDLQVFMISFAHIAIHYFNP